MEVIILGCGFSLGCPVLACKCSICTSDRRYNKRTRSAIIIKSAKSTILVDFGPDIKHQLHINNIDHIDAVICTHAHADHISGIDELRVFEYNEKKYIDLYTNKETSKRLTQNFSYIFKSKNRIRQFLEMKLITNFQKINIAGVEFQFFKQIHGNSSSLGFRINNFVYSNDVTDFPKTSTGFLKGIDRWVLDCIDYKRTKGHAGLEEVLSWQEQYEPKQIFLTNLGHNIDYDIIKKQLPKGILPAHDGLIIKI